MAPDRADALLGFLTLADQLKHVLRKGRTLSAEGQARWENSAEHSWHVALAAVLLHGEVGFSVDLGRALAMIAAHDLVEIEAGDTFAFDAPGAATQAARELAAADRIFATLPPDLGQPLRALWEEFEAGESNEARFAMGCDRLQGFCQGVISGGLAWRQAGVTVAQSARRMDPAAAVDPAFGALITRLRERAMDEALLVP
ncbi:HD domain-containing protein [Humitalea sp. 24SJ18S-53]|uniref:HD domain-containing protein n=1 Tax=Humitalea sp. 24SJ18S-53 TaxID=3422307 RepID=UPI003D6754B6